MAFEYADKCKHFNGIQHNECKVGVQYEHVRDVVHRLPCLSAGTRGPAESTCVQRELMTQAEHEARTAEVEAGTERILATLRAGKCHVCGADSSPTKQVGRCLYSACGHRIGQV